MVASPHRRPGSPALKVVVAPNKGKLSAEDETTLREKLTKESPPIFPNRPVGPGDEWTLDPAAAKRLFTGAESVSAKIKFVEILPYQGHRCAKLAFAVDVGGHIGNGPVKMRMKLDITGYFAMDTQRGLVLDGGGPITGDGEVDQGGTKIKMSAQGTFKATQTTKWLAVGK